MDKRWVFVSGGSRGIGAGIVRTLAAEGYPLAFTYVASDAAARALEDELAGVSPWCRGYRCDMGDKLAVAQLARDLSSTHGAPYALINNVGITRDALLLNMADEQWSDVLRTNLDSAYHLSRAFVASMIEAGDGCIVNMTSVTGLKGNPGQVNYAATKAALIGMTRSLAVELGRFNIRVNAVAPGVIATEMTAGLNEMQLKHLMSGIPLRRLGRVDEVAANVAFLLGPASRYTTGHTLMVDGGLTA